MNNNNNNIPAVDDPLNPPMYSAFNGAGFQLGLFIPALIFSILALFGIPFNISLCYVTIRHRKSAHHCKTATLLAMNAFFEILHQLGHFVFLAIAISGTNFYPVRLALSIQFFAIVGAISGAKMLALLSFDRLFAVLTPLIYHHIDEKKYISIHILALAIMDINFLYFLILGRINYPEWPCNGNVGDFVGIPGMAQSTQIQSFTVFGAAVFSYLLVGILVKIKTSSNSEVHKKIYKSLMLIVLVSLSGYVLFTAANVLNFLFKLPFTRLQFWYFSVFSYVLVNIASVANAPILFWISTEYRNAYLNEFRLLKRIYEKAKENTTVIVVQPAAAAIMGSTTR